MVNVHSNLATFSEWESIVTPYAMAYWRISCSYISTWSPLFDKTFTSWLSTDFVKFCISYEITSNVHVWCRGRNTRKMITSKWFRFIIAKLYSSLRYVIARILRHMCNLHIKETEISRKRSKEIKNWKITYSVILSVFFK